MYFYVNVYAKINFWKVGDIYYKHWDIEKAQALRFKDKAPIGMQIGKQKNSACMSAWFAPKPKEGNGREGERWTAKYPVQKSQSVEGGGTAAAESQCCRRCRRCLRYRHISPRPNEPANTALHPSPPSWR